MKAFRLGGWSSSTYSSEAPNDTVQNQLKRRQQYTEKLRLRGHLNLQVPKRDCMGDDEQSLSVDGGTVSRGKGPELWQEKFCLFFGEKKRFEDAGLHFQ